MKFFKLFMLAVAVAFTITSCQKEKENIWDIKVETPAEKVPITDISKEFFEKRYLEIKNASMILRLKQIQFAFYHHELQRRTIK